MPTPTYIPLANLTLSSSAASVTFSSISQAYRDLVLVINAGATGAYQLTGNINSDTGANYNWIWMRGSGTAASTGVFDNFTYPLFYNSVLGTTDGLAIISFNDYSATDKHKTWLTRGNHATTYGVGADTGRWASTSAITSIQLKPGANNWTSGSTFALYGIAA